MRKMPPGSFVAMGTNGLTDIEVRCIAHALKLANVAGAAALRFQEMVSAKLATLPDLDDDALPAVAQQPGASPAADGGMGATGLDWHAWKAAAVGARGGRSVLRHAVGSASARRRWQRHRRHHRRRRLHRHHLLGDRLRLPPTTPCSPRRPWVRESTTVKRRGVSGCGGSRRTCCAKSSTVQAPPSLCV